jgi:NADPH:quinone reductase-like Zn-dependent oxidoreductase
MKAIVYKEYGSPDVLHIIELPRPVPADDEVLIAVYAAEVTKADCEMRSFNFSVKWFWLPLRLFVGLRRPKKQMLGGYFAGQVVDTGKDVTKLQVGDSVFGCTRMRSSAYAEYLCLPESYSIVTKPESISYEEAAAVPLGGLNALHFMRKANIKQGDKVLINGAGGSIGSFALQIAKSMGADVTVVDSHIKQTMLEGLGADEFIDYTKTDVTKQGQTYDVIFNMVPQSRYTDFIKLLNPNGRYVIGNPKFSDMLHSVFTSRLTGKQTLFAFAGEKEQELIDLREMLESGQIKAPIDKVFSMTEISAAHQRVETEQRKGIVLLSFDKKV